MVTRLAVIALVWACACGIHGHVPWLRAEAAQATVTPDQARCGGYADHWNQLAAAKRVPLRIILLLAQRPDGEAVSYCEYLIENIETLHAGCYMAVIDSSLRSWEPFKYRPNCLRPWPKPTGPAA